MGCVPDSSDACRFFIGCCTCVDFILLRPGYFCIPVSILELLWDTVKLLRNSLYFQVFKHSLGRWVWSCTQSEADLPSVYCSQQPSESWGFPGRLLRIGTVPSGRSKCLLSSFCTVLFWPRLVSSHACTDWMSGAVWQLSPLWSPVPGPLATSVSPDSAPLSSARLPGPCPDPCDVSWGLSSPGAHLVYFPSFRNHCPLFPDVQFHETIISCILSRFLVIQVGWLSQVPSDWPKVEASFTL